MPRIVPINSSTIQEAARILRAGGAVAFPTETVYGLGAHTFNSAAIDLVYELKGRPADNPLIAHVLDAQQAREVIAAGAWDDRCDALAQRFWPGPLTLVLRRASRVPERATAGRPTIAVRAPRHPAARALLEAIGEGEPISAPSANRSGRVSPTTAQHVVSEFAEIEAARDLLILDGGPCEVGIESTVLDLSIEPPRILRHGSVTLEELRSLIPEIAAPAITSQSASPGTAASHYAPHTPAQLVASPDVRESLARLAEARRRCAALVFDAGSVGPTTAHAAIVMPPDAAQYARVMYARLREADGLGCDAIVIESPPGNSLLWRAVHDRLGRATAERR